MKKGCYLFIHFLPAGSAEPVGQFYLGSDPVSARILFDELQGSAEITEGGFLFMELMQYQDGLPVNLLLKNCTLTQLGENCKIVTKELFKMITLGE